jgi:hypothetical protein
MHTPTAQFTATGEGDVTLKVTVLRGLDTSCAQSDTVVIPLTSTPIIAGPRDATVRRGAKTTLTIAGTTGPNVRYDWYASSAVGEWTLVASGPSNLYTTPPLQRTTSYRVSALNPCGIAESRTATVTVANTRRRAARH